MAKRRKKTTKKTRKTTRKTHTIRKGTKVVHIHL